MKGSKKCNSCERFKSLKYFEKYKSNCTYCESIINDTKKIEKEVREDKILESYNVGDFTLTKPLEFTINKGQTREVIGRIEQHKDPKLCYLILPSRV